MKIIKYRESYSKKEGYKFEVKKGRKWVIKKITGVVDPFTGIPIGGNL